MVNHDLVEKVAVAAGSIVIVYELDVTIHCSTRSHYNIGAAKALFFNLKSKVNSKLDVERQIALVGSGRVLNKMIG